MLNFVSKFVKKRIVIVVGDTSASIFYIVGLSVKDSLVVEGIFEDKVKEIRTFLLKYAKQPVYLLVDTSDQAINYDFVTNVKSSLFKKLVERKIRKEYKREDFVNYYRIKNKKTLASKANIFFVITEIAHAVPLTHWIELLEKLPLMLAGIYSLPVESENIAREIDKLFNVKIEKSKTKKVKKGKQKKKEEEEGVILTEEERLLKQDGLVKLDAKDLVKKPVNDGKKAHWKMMVFQNYSSGIRLVVLKENQVVFSRVLHIIVDEEEVPVEKAIQIKTQILGTVEYLKRIDYREREGIEIFFMVSKSLQHPLKLEAGEVDNIKFIDLDDARRKFFKKEGKFDVSKGADELLAVFFAEKGRHFYFLTKKMKKAAQLVTANISATIILGFVVLASLLILSINFVKLVSFKSDISTYKTQETVFSRKLKVIREKTFGSDLDENMVMEVHSIHEGLKKDSSVPLDFIVRFISIKIKNVDVKSILWEEKSQGKYQIRIKASFNAENLTVEELFAYFDSFIRDVKTEFTNYDITHSELPDTITFGKSKEVLPIEMELKGPN